MSRDFTKLAKDAFYQSVTLKEDFPACFSIFIADLANNSRYQRKNIQIQAYHLKNSYQLSIYF